mmetsp:Transcript_16358/g.21494  ORF Transcript_16358/g.21494 Transcript_16358/m.21494 type:complete len:309 (-) Transcript_16358:1357-2283(-)
MAAPKANGVPSQKPVRKKSRVDSRPHYLRSLFFVSIYIITFAYVVTETVKQRGGSGPPGLRFHPQYNYWVSNEIVYGLPLLYVLFVLIGCRVMRNFSSLETQMKALQPIYNLIQIVVCGYMVYGLFPCVGVWNEKLPFAMNTAFSKDIEYFVWIHYLTKFLDWTDTFFMVFKKKFNQISFLHVFHHATIGVIWGFLLNEGVGSGTAGFGAWMNSLTHVIMYTHYLVTSFGINNPFKRYITRWQLFQFATCFVHSVVILGGPYDTVLPKVYAMLQLMYQTFMLMLFGTLMAWVPSWLVGADISSDKKEN